MLGNAEGARSTREGKERKRLSNIGRAVLGRPGRRAELARQEISPLSISRAPLTSRAVPNTARPILLKRLLRRLEAVRGHISRHFIVAMGQY